MLEMDCEEEFVRLRNIVGRSSLGIYFTECMLIKR